MNGIILIQPDSNQTLESAANKISESSDWHVVVGTPENIVKLEQESLTSGSNTSVKVALYETNSADYTRAENLSSGVIFESNDIRLLRYRTDYENYDKGTIILLKNHLSHKGIRCLDVMSV